MLKANRFYKVHVAACGGDLEVEANGRRLFEENHDSMGTIALEGEIGVGAHDSRMMFKDFALRRDSESDARSAVAKYQISDADNNKSTGGHTRRHSSQLDRAASSMSSFSSSSSVVSSLPSSADQVCGVDPSLAVTVERDIVHRGTGVSLSEIVGLDNPKRLLEEAVTLPLLLPEFFTGLREPWRGVLLFGPPGCGKTMLAKAAAGMHTNQITFFNVSSATIVNKWRGESEKIVRTLFTLARSRKFSPSIVFLDEIDAVASVRGSRTEHDADRRLKSLLFSEIDGVINNSNCSSKSKSPSIMVLATTNRPWDIDEAMRRRLEKRIYVGLPDNATRGAMLRLHLSSAGEFDGSGETKLGEDQNGGCKDDEDESCKGGKVCDASPPDLPALAAATEGFSGADIRLLCREAAMMPMRRLLEGKSTQEMVALRRNGGLDAVGMITHGDFEAALQRTKPSVALSPQALDRFRRWAEEFGST
jgi:katanin p60 ATPase-containing subunit A1